MKTLYVYADFDWIEETELVGELGYESLRSSDCYCFTRMLCRVIGGRTLLLRREQIVAMEEKRPVRRLFPFDYLIGIDGFSRMGAFYCRNDFPFGTKLG